MDGVPIQPLVSALAATTHVQAAQSAQRAAEIRRAQNRVKVSSIDQDTLERQVESSDAIEGVHDKPDEHPSGRRQRRSKNTPEPDEDEPPHIDLTA
jgi:hypothetical protein